MVESMNEDFNVEEKQDMESGLGQTNLEGKVRISEDVIAQLATKALNSVEGVSPARPGLMANLRLGRKTVTGVRISISDGDISPLSTACGSPMSAGTSRRRSKNRWSAIRVMRSRA